MANTLIDTYPLNIDGQWIETDAGRYDDISPATEAVIAQAPDTGPAEVDAAVAAARAAFDSGACLGLGLTNDEIDDLRARRVIGETALNA